MYSAVGKARPLSAEARREERQRAVEGLRAAADYATPAGVSLAIEPLNRFETEDVYKRQSAVATMARSSWRQWTSAVPGHRPFGLKARCRPQR